MLDFDSASLAASEGLAQASQSSTDLALRFGLSGTWSATPGSQIHEWVEAQGDEISISRLAPPEVMEACTTDGLFRLWGDALSGGPSLNRLPSFACRIVWVVSTSFTEPFHRQACAS